MHADLQDRLKQSRDELREFLESLHREDEPGRFQIALGGVTESGAEVSLAPSCMALRTACTLDLWRQVDREDQQRWLDFIRSFQRLSRLDGEPLTEGAFLDPALHEAQRSARGGLQRALRLRSDALRELALGSTRRAVSALALAGAYPETPYRALPDAPRPLQSTLERFDWRDPASAARLSADVVTLVTTQTRHFLELTQVQQLKLLSARHLESMADAATGGYFRDEMPRYAQLICAAGHVLDALAYLNEPPHWPEKLIDTCLAGRPAVDGTGCEIDDWARVLHHCAQHTSHRRAEIRAAVPDALELILAHRQSDGGWSNRPGGGVIQDGPLQLTAGGPAGDLYGTCRLVDAAAMLIELSGWDLAGWKVLRR